MISKYFPKPPHFRKNKDQEKRVHVLAKTVNPPRKPMMLGRSLSSLNDDIQITTFRVQQSLSNCDMIAPLIATLDTLLRMNARLQLSLQLFLDPSIVEKSIRDEILNGNIFNAYKSFLKLEKCRNDLLDLCVEDETEETSKFIARCFSNVEETGLQIRDVILLTLSSKMDIEIGTGEQIIEIIEKEIRLDKVDEALKRKGERGLLERPRNWCQSFRATINEQPVDADSTFSSWISELPLLQKGKGTVHDDIRYVLNTPYELEGEPRAVYRLVMSETEEESGYQEELVTLKKYFKDLEKKQVEFQQELQKIFSIDKIFQEAEDSLKKSNFLRAYERLAEAEGIRLHLLAKCSEFKNAAFIHNIIEGAFEALEVLHDDYKKGVQYYCERALDIMRGEEAEPRRQLEIVLSIIEIDEKIDSLYKSKAIRTEKRPHCWKQHFFKLMEGIIQKRIDVYQIEDKSINEDWLTRYLELCRMFIVDDLRAAKKFLLIFPKEHQLYDRFVVLYHKNISNKLREIASKDLVKREVVQLLHWINNYTNEDLLGDPYLQINADAIIDDYPLVSRSDIDDMHNVFVTTTMTEVAKWSHTAVNNEFDTKEAKLEDGIEHDPNGHSYTNLPYILFSIIKDQLILAEETDDELVPKVLELCLSEYFRVASLIKKRIIKLKKLCYEDEECVIAFTPAMVAIANDMNKCAKSTEALRVYISEEKALKASSSSSADESIVSPELQTSPQVSTKLPAVGHGKQNRIKKAIRTAFKAVTDYSKSSTPTASPARRMSTPDAEIKSITALSEGDCKEPEDGQKSLSETSSLFSLNLGRKCPPAPITEHLTLSQKLDLLKSDFNALEQLAINILFKEFQDDLEDLFDELLSKQWVKKQAVIETICVTINDYSNDYQRLKPQLRLNILMSILYKLISSYLRAIGNRRITSTNYQKRCKIAKALAYDAQRIRETVGNSIKQIIEDETPLNLIKILEVIAEVLELKDKMMLPLEAASVIRKYPNMPRELLFAIIDARNDITSNESWEVVDDSLKATDKREGDPMFDYLFQLSRPEKKTSDLMKGVVPRLRRRVKLTLSH